MIALTKIWLQIFNFLTVILKSLDIEHSAIAEYF